MSKISWHGLSEVDSKKYTCGYCNANIASQQGYIGSIQPSQILIKIYICHYCYKPTFFDFDANQFPGVMFGKSLSHLPNVDLESLYNEARKCFSIMAYNSVVMLCRKLLMNISVNEGATEGQSFVEYVNFLETNNYIPPKGREWVDRIRKLGNDTTHKLEPRTKNEAELILHFIEMLLRFIYEVPATLPSI